MIFFFPRGRSRGKIQDTKREKQTVENDAPAICVFLRTSFIENKGSRSGGISMKEVLRRTFVQ
jgi:hypothetical protein